MAEQLMEMALRTALWRQFGAAIDMLEKAMLACPAQLWNQRLWKETSVSIKQVLDSRATGQVSKDQPASPT